MVCEFDIWQAANDLIARYGARAVLRAGARIDDCTRAGDRKSRAAWVEILRVISALQSGNDVVAASRPAPRHAGTGIVVTVQFGRRAASTADADTGRRHQVRAR
jgi:hypothetical protein